MGELVQRLLNDDDGQDLVEYGLLVAGIAAIVAGAVAAFGLGVDGGYEDLVVSVAAMLGG